LKKTIYVAYFNTSVESVNSVILGGVTFFWIINYSGIFMGKSALLANISSDSNIGPS
jgi:hypothetical protein